MPASRLNRKALYLNVSGSRRPARPLARLAGRRVPRAQIMAQWKNLHNGLGKRPNGLDGPSELRGLIDHTQDLWKTPFLARQTVCLKFFGP
jgi:hypothetical protein